MNDTGYRVHERRLLARKVREIENQPKADKREAGEEFAAALTETPHIVVERMGWLLGGSYGWAEAEAAHRVLAGVRNNKRAALLHLVGRHEWSCPTYGINKAWKSLDDQGKAAVNEMIDSYVGKNPEWRKEWGL